MKHKLGAFHQPGPAVDFLNACFYGNQSGGGGYRGGRGGNQRGGYGGQGDYQGSITRTRGFFAEQRNMKKALGHLKGLMVSVKKYRSTRNSTVFRSISVIVMVAMVTVMVAMACHQRQEK